MGVGHLSLFLPSLTCAPDIIAGREQTKWTFGGARLRKRPPSSSGISVREQISPMNSWWSDFDRDTAQKGRRRHSAPNSITGGNGRERVSATCFTTSGGLLFSHTRCLQMRPQRLLPETLFSKQYRIKSWR